MQLFLRRFAKSLRPVRGHHRTLLHGAARAGQPFRRPRVRLGATTVQTLRYSIRKRRRAKRARFLRPGSARRRKIIRRLRERKGARKQPYRELTFRGPKLRKHYHLSRGAPMG